MSAGSLANRLLAAAGADGGWPYYEGRSSRLEPTAWSLLALSRTAAADLAPGLPAHMAYLSELQQPSGLLLEAGNPVVSLAWNGLTFVLLDHLSSPAGRAIAPRLVAGLVAVKGAQLQDGGAVTGQNNELQAWPWMTGTFSWVEPTALCLLAVKQAGPLVSGSADRIREAEAVLFDRVCPTGGWNYGNATVLGQDLRAYVPTTALALMALQDRRGHPVTDLSLSWLEAHASSEPSSMALSLATICLAVYRRPVAHLIARLGEQEARTDFLGNRHLMAMALYAMTAGSHDVPDFRVTRTRDAAASGSTRE